MRLYFPVLEEYFLLIFKNSNTIPTIPKKILKLLLIATKENY